MGIKDWEMNAIIIFAIIGLIFGSWKIIEIIMWIFSHLHWN